MKVDWDDALPSEISKKFQNWSNQLSEVKQVKIPRWIGFSTQNLNSSSLHVFSDASKISYAACVFIRIKIPRDTFPEK